MSAEIVYRGIDEYNKAVKSWASKVQNMLKGNIKASKGIGELKRSLKHKTFSTSGEIDAISYRFPRHGIFYQKGVGRGHIMQGGTVVRGLKSSKVVRMIDGNVNREPVDWFNKTMDNQVPKLADIVATHKADEAVVKSFGMKIK
jgi:hypothetical protein